MLEGLPLSKMSDGVKRLLDYNCRLSMAKKRRNQIQRLQLIRQARRSSWPKKKDLLLFRGYSRQHITSVPTPKRHDLHALEVAARQWC